MIELCKTPKIWAWPLAIVSLALIGCGGKPKLKPFESDGCSLFPDASMITGDDWCACCFQHDLAYWKGGTETERRQADEALRDCVQEITGNAEFAEFMFNGVRFGGSPYFYNWYRWGYGWGYERQYGPLTEEELKQVEQRLKEIDFSQTKSPCS